jgi:amino-acid N-acetyltransferase
VRWRGAIGEDLPALRSLLTSSGLRADDVEDRIDQTVVGDLRQDPGGIVATACLQEARGDDAAEPARAGVLRSVAVLRDSRGKGLGQLGTAAAVAWGRARGITQIYVFTETAEGFFQSMGFRRIDREQVPPPVTGTAHADEECPTATAMTLSL